MKNFKHGFDLTLPISKVVNLGRSHPSLLEPEFSRLKTEVTDYYEG